MTEIKKVPKKMGRPKVSAKQGITVDLAKRLYIFRTEVLKMDRQGDFAKAVGDTQNNISRWENNIINIPPDIISRLHTKFNMSLEWFYTGKGRRQEVPEKSTLVTDISELNDKYTLVLARLKKIEDDIKILASRL